MFEQVWSIAADAPTKGGFSLVKYAAAHSFVEIPSVSSERRELLMSIKERTEGMLALTALACVGPSTAKRFESLHHEARDCHFRETVGRCLQDRTNVTLLETTMDCLGDSVAMQGLHISPIIGHPVIASELWVYSNV